MSGQRKPGRRCRWKRVFHASRCSAGLCGRSLWVRYRKPLDMNSRPGVSYGPASFRAARALASFQFAFVLAALAATIQRLAKQLGSGAARTALGVTQSSSI
jgi:hypothetical protein